MTTENMQRKKFQSLSHGLGITGLIMGIVTLLVSFIPCFGMFAVFFGIVALLITLIGLIIAFIYKHPKGLLIGALTTSLLGCSIAYYQMSVIDNLGKPTYELEKEVDK